MARSPQDWAALEKREREGHESPGTVARLKALEAGLPAPAEVVSDPLKALLQLAELVSADKATKARLAQLQQATEAARAEQIAAAREKVAAEKLKADAAEEYRKHQERMAAEREHHESWMTAARAELQAEIAAKTQAIDGQLKAAAAERAALRQKADQLRQHLESAA